jgi:hypothetical protein
MVIVGGGVGMGVKLGGVLLGNGVVVSVVLGIPLVCEGGTKVGVSVGMYEVGVELAGKVAVELADEVVVAVGTYSVAVV